MLVALLLALAPESGAAERPHVAVVAGAGLAYAYVGAHVEVRYKTAAVFFGLPLVPDAAAQWPLSEQVSVFATGVRFIANGESGLLLSFQFTRARYQHHLDTGFEGSLLDPAGHDTYTATIGWRFRAGLLLVDLGLGGGVAHDFDHHGDGYDSFAGPLYRSTYPYLDGAAAVGVEF